MRRVRSQFLRPAFQLALAVPGRWVAARAADARPSQWTGATKFAIACAVAFAAIPAQGAVALPDGMHYELVSPADTGGTALSADVMSSDGSRIQIGSNSSQGWGGTPSFNTTANLSVASRTSSGWVTAPLNAPASPGLAFAAAWDQSEDLTASVTATATAAQYHASQLQFQRVGLNGTVQQTLPAITDLTGTSQDLLGTGYIVFSYGGTSADLSHVVFLVDSAKRLLAADSPPRGQTGLRLYEVHGIGTASATLRRVDIDIGGAELGFQCGAQFGGYDGYVNGNANSYSTSNAISRDGSRIFFSARPGADNLAVQCSAVEATRPVHVFARVGGVETVDLSASECQRPGCSTTVSDASYQDASKDGGKVLFISSDQLADSDLDSGRDLYMYDFAKPAGHHLSQLSIGDASGGRTPGSGAAAQAVVKTSDDGSRVYFLASGVLTTDANSFGQTATAGADNLYLYEPVSDTTSFVATVNPADKLGTHNLGEGSSLSNTSGDVLVFATKVSLTLSDADSVSDVYRYDATNGELAKVSPGDTADSATMSVKPNDAFAAPQQRVASTDGHRIVFRTAASLVSEDVNGKRDAYLWDDGSVQLVSDGRDPGGAELSGISASGDQVAFSTLQRLVPEDTDNVRSGYVVRTGPDIVRPPDTVECDGDACQGPLAAPPALSEVGSVDFAGPGNASVAGGRTSVSVSRPRSVTGSTASLKVRVPAAGRISISGVSIHNRTTSAPKAATYTVKVKLGAKARKALARNNRLSVRVKVLFRPRTGHRTAKTVTVIFRQSRSFKQSAGR